MYSVTYNSEYGKSAFVSIKGAICLTEPWSPCKYHADF